MRVSLGQPSRMGDLQTAVERPQTASEDAAAARSELEAGVAAADRARAARRFAFAGRVGQNVRRATAIGLAIVYVAVVAVGGYWLSSNLPLAIATGVAFTAGLAAFDWQYHIDGFWLASCVGAWAETRVESWLGTFDAR